MKRLFYIAAVLTLATARPELYKENEDFQFSRSSSDDGTKSGFYGAQRGNMGGNYEKAHNMDGLAQHQMSGLVRQVDGELGEGLNTRTGSVYSSANSRGIYGSGRYDLSNLQGRNFQEGVNNGDSQSHSSSSHNSAYTGQSASSMHSSGYNSQSQNAAYSGYHGTKNHGQVHADTLQAIDSTHGAAGTYGYGHDSAQAASHNSHLTSHSSGYQSQSGYQSHSGYDSSNTDQHTSSHGVNPQSRLIAVPVRVYGRPGQRIAVPVGAQIYDANQASSFDHNAINSEAEVLSTADQQANYRPTGNGKRYESSYSYRKQWEKHDTSPEVVALSMPTENPLVNKNSELYDDAQVQSSNNQYHAGGSHSHSAHTSNAYNYNSNSQAALSSQSSQHSSAASQHNAGAAATSNSAYTHGGHNSGSLVDGTNDLGSANSRPKGYHSSYSYHKSWERQGDPYVIQPVGGATTGQESQRLTAANTNNAYSSHGYGSHYSNGHASQIDCDCDDDGHARVARSTHGQYDNYQQNQYEELGQQTQNAWDNLGQSQNARLENFGQQSQRQWEGLEDLGQQTQNRWENLGQQTHKNLARIEQQNQNEWENLGQRTQDRWDTLQAEQSQTDMGQQTQNVWSIGGQQYQQNEGAWVGIEDKRNEFQNSWDHRVHFNNKNHQQATWDNTHGFEPQSHKDFQEKKIHNPWEEFDIVDYKDKTVGEDQMSVSGISKYDNSEHQSSFSSFWDKINDFDEASNNNNKAENNSDHEIVWNQQSDNNYFNQHDLKNFNSNSTQEDTIQARQTTSTTTPSTFGLAGANLDKTLHSNEEHHASDIGRGDIGPEETGSDSNPLLAMPIQSNDYKSHKTTENIETLSMTTGKEKNEISNDFHSSHDNQSISNFDTYNKLGQQTSNFDRQINNFEQQQTGNFEQQAGNFDQLTGNFEQQTSNFEQQTGNFEQQTGNFEQQTGNFEQQTGNFEQQTGNFEQQTGNFEQQTGNFKHQTGNFEQQTGNFEQQTGGFDQQTSNLEQQTGNFDKTTGNFEQQSGNFEQQTGNFEQQTGNFEQQTNNFEQQTGGFDQQTSNFEQKSGNFDKTTGNFEQQSGNIEEQNGKFAQQSNNFEQKGAFDQQSGNFEQQTGNVDQQTGNYEQQTGKFDQQTGNFELQTGNLNKHTGNIKNNTNSEPQSENLEHKTGRSGQQTGNFEQQQGDNFEQWSDNHEQQDTDSNNFDLEHTHSVEQNPVHEFEDFAKMLDQKFDQHMDNVNIPQFEVQSNKFHQQNEDINRQLDTFHQNQILNQQSEKSNQQLFWGQNIDDLEREHRPRNEAEDFKYLGNETQQEAELQLVEPLKRSMDIQTDKFYKENHALPKNDKHPEAIEHIQDIENKNMVTELKAAQNNTRTEQPLETSTNASFWNSVGSKLSNAKNKVRSWFHGS